MEKWPIGVFASIDAGLGVKLEVAHELGIPTVQLHAPKKESRTPDNAEKFLKRLEELGIRITVVFGGFEGESYADIPTTARTVGLVPAETRAERVQELKEISDFARLLGVDAVGLHLGFIPHDAGSGLFDQVVNVTREVCDHCRSNDQTLHLETGQESADDLLQFIAAVDRDNLFVNFDPANMILYGSGEPVEALGKVGKYVRSVHCKDARWAAKPGEEWGTELPLGEGDVGMENFLAKLKEIGYAGPLTIGAKFPRSLNVRKPRWGVEYDCSSNSGRNCSPSPPDWPADAEPVIIPGAGGSQSHAGAHRREMHRRMNSGRPRPILQNNAHGTWPVRQSPCGFPEVGPVQSPSLKDSRDEMPKVDIAIAHQLGTEEATRRLQDRFHNIKEKFGPQVTDMEERWNGDSLQFGFRTFGLKISGQVESKPEEVKVRADLPMAAMMFKGQIEQQIREELTRILAG